jgi:hypothetical protein
VVGEPEGSIPPGIHSRRWEDNIKVYFKEVGRGCGLMDWIDLAEDRYRWWAFVNTVMNLVVP